MTRSLLRKVPVMFAMAFALAACNGESPQGRALSAAQTSLPPMQTVAFMGGKLTISVPAHFTLQMDNPPNLKAYGNDDAVVLLVTAKVPDGMSKDPKVLLDETEANLKRQDPKLTVLSKGEVLANGRAIQTLSLVMNQPAKGEVYSLVAIDVRADQMITITQVIGADAKDRHAPIAEAVVKSLSDA